MRNITIICLTILTACGSGGNTGSNPSNGKINSYLVNASVSQNGCGGRISDVQQSFNFTEGQVDTGLFQVVTSRSGNAVDVIYSYQGACLNTYEASFQDTTAPETPVTLKRKAQCGPKTCENIWIGKATASSISKEAEVEKVNGERCNPMVPKEVGYRPSQFECDGDSAILLSGGQRSAFSVVVRTLGTFNDRDPANPSCATNVCSPFKTQSTIDLPAFKVFCLGGSGFSSNFSKVTRISIKYSATVTDPMDTKQFEQYCLNTKQNLH